MMASERHGAVKVGSIELRFVTRPISTPPWEGAIGFLDGLTAKGNPGRQIAVFKDGEWRGGAGGQALRITPSTWTVCAETDAEAKRKGYLGGG